MRRLAGQLELQTLDLPQFLFIIVSIMNNHTSSEVLTNDEKKAAEAAFSRRPFNPSWSEKARHVYDGITNALPLPAESQQQSDQKEGKEETKTAPTAPANEREGQTDRPSTIPFQQALETGVLIDVTPAAQQLGLSFPVTVTRPLWEMGISPTNTTTEAEQSARLRDVLMALRLRLTGQPTLSPLIDFPALLALPPNSVPQAIPLFALIQPDEQNRATVTLLLPNEVSASIIPLN